MHAYARFILAISKHLRNIKTMIISKVSTDKTSHFSLRNICIIHYRFGVNYIYINKVTLNDNSNFTK